MAWEPKSPPSCVLRQLYVAIFVFLTTPQQNTIEIRRCGWDGSRQLTKHGRIQEWLLTHFHRRRHLGIISQDSPEDASIGG